MTGTLVRALASKLDEMSLRAEMQTDEHSITFRAAHPQVGDLKIFDEGDELTVMVGRAHAHFDGPEDTARFVNELLSDGWEFSWLGFRRRKSQSSGLWWKLLGGKKYVWSGPL